MASHPDKAKRMAFPDIFPALSTFATENKSVLLVLFTSMVGSGFGAWFGARAILLREDRNRNADILSVSNIAIASLAALLGKLINFKKDLAFPAAAEAESLSELLSDAQKGTERGKMSIKIELWPEAPFALSLPNDRLYEYAGKELAVVQLMKMLECNLAELSHLVSERNGLIRQMNAHQAAKGVLPVDGLQLYMKHASEIARNVDENLFFIDRVIEKIRSAAVKSLPKRLHGGIAELPLRPETQPLMPPADFIRGLVK